MNPHDLGELLQSLGPLLVATLGPAPETGLGIMAYRQWSSIRTIGGGGERYVLFKEHGNSVGKGDTALPSLRDLHRLNGRRPLPVGIW